MDLHILKKKSAFYRDISNIDLDRWWFLSHSIALRLMLGRINFLANFTSTETISNAWREHLNLYLKSNSVRLLWRDEYRTWSANLDCSIEKNFKDDVHNDKKEMPNCCSHLFSIMHVIFQKSSQLTSSHFFCFSFEKKMKNNLLNCNIFYTSFNLCAKKTYSTTYLWDGVASMQ